MPAFALEPRLSLLLWVGWFLEDGDCVIETPRTVSVIAAGVIEEDIEGKDVEIEVKKAEYKAQRG